MCTFALWRLDLVEKEELPGPEESLYARWDPPRYLLRGLLESWWAWRSARWSPPEPLLKEITFSKGVDSSEILERTYLGILERFYVERRDSRDDIYVPLAGGGGGEVGECSDGGGSRLLEGDGEGYT